MNRFRFTPQARRDLLEISNFIARDSEDAAYRVEQKILDACLLISKSPFAGQLRPDFTPRPLRFWVVGKYPNYVVVYDPQKKPVRIVRILHGARQLAALLK